MRQGDRKDTLHPVLDGTNLDVLSKPTLFASSHALVAPVRRPTRWNDALI
jgi:hypothetical protein